MTEEGATSSKNSDNVDTVGWTQKKESLWIFGYGSLCWNPGFEYQQSLTGYVKGFSRRFWQGNTTHRGTEEKPGRVATLIEDNDGITWGKAFLVAPSDTKALPYLASRECRLGGYRTCKVSFIPKPSHDLTESKRALLYIAVPDNKLWLGYAPLHEIARQIVECEGPSGSNAEYLLRLADFMRDEIPEALDDHLFSLERLVRKFASDMKLCITTLMGEAKVKDDDKAKDDSRAPKQDMPSLQYASRLPGKKLRCVNM